MIAAGSIFSLGRCDGSALGIISITCSIFDGTLVGADDGMPLSDGVSLALIDGKKEGLNVFDGVPLGADDGTPLSDGLAVGLIDGMWLIEGRSVGLTDGVTVLVGLALGTVDGTPLSDGVPLALIDGVWLTEG